MAKATIEYYWSPARVTKVLKNKPVAGFEVRVRILDPQRLCIAHLSFGWPNKKSARAAVVTLVSVFEPLLQSGPVALFEQLVADKVILERGPGAKPLGVLA